MTRHLLYQYIWLMKDAINTKECVKRSSGFSGKINNVIQDIYD